MTSDLLESNQQFESNQSRGVGTKCVGTKQLFYCNSSVALIISHIIVMMNPVDNVNNKPSRTFREVRVRPLRQGGMEKLKNWFQAQEWGEVMKEESVDKKAEILAS